MVNCITINVGYITIVLSKIMAKSIFDPLVLFHVLYVTTLCSFSYYTFGTLLDQFSFYIILLQEGSTLSAVGKKKWEWRYGSSEHA